MQNLNLRIKQIDTMLTHGLYTPAAKESLALIEYAMRRLLRLEVVRLEGKDRLKVNQAELQIGKGQKSIEDFTMGQLLGVIRTSRFFDAWTRSTGGSLGSVEMINLDAVVKLRNKLVHDGTDAERSDAELLQYVLRVFLETFGIMMLEETDGSRSSPEAPKKRTAYRETKTVDIDHGVDPNHTETASSSSSVVPAVTDEPAENGRKSEPRASEPAKASNGGDTSSEPQVKWEIMPTLRDLRRAVRPKLKEIGGRSSIVEDEDCIRLRVRFKHPVWSKEHHLFVDVGEPFEGHCAWLGTSISYPKWIQKPLERSVHQALHSDDKFQVLLQDNAPEGVSIPSVPLPIVTREEFINVSTELLLQWASLLPPLIERSWDALPAWAQTVSVGDPDLIKTRTVLKHDCEEARNDLCFLENLADALWIKGELIQAEKHLRSLVRQVPDYRFAHYNLGLVAVELKDWTKANRYFSEAYKRFPERSFFLLESYRYAAFKVKEYARAVEISEEILKIDPERESALRFHGALLMRAGRDAEAEAIFRRCISENREKEFVYEDYAKLLEKRGSYREAIEVLKQNKKKDGSLYASARKTIEKIEGKMKA